MQSHLDKTVKWVGVSGGWAKTNDEIEGLVRKTVREIILAGQGIVSGGALGVDFIALDEALKQNPGADRIRIYIPTPLDNYTAHYRRRAEEGVITAAQAESLIRQLSSLKNVNRLSLIELERTIINEETYFERNSAVVKAADELVAFHIITEVFPGTGTLDTIVKAKEKGIPVKVFTYDLREK
ncbi:MAG: hypothetical protein HYW37_00480 [Candidatus Colwellbacteria bacterium]|nr:hypothetical protein [Candidatus Colwellbacteria bacterium]